MADLFVLVNPPFVSVCRPNLGLSLLKATLCRDGHPARVFYADHVLASRLGLEAYDAIFEVNDHMVGEWLFSGCVRGHWDPRLIDYLQRRGLPAWASETLWGGTVYLGGYVQAVARQVLQWSPAVVGCSSTFQQNNASLAILKAIKTLRPQVVTVMGGANLEGELGLPVVRYPWVDFIVSGEAEGCISRFYELCGRYGRHIPSTELPPEVTASPDWPPQRGKVADLDALPFPDFSDYFQSLAAFPNLASVTPHLTLEGSRGCWWGQVQHCTFCGLNGSGMAYRAKAPGRLLEEIQSLSLRHGIDHIEMVDNILSPKHLQQLLPLLARQRRGWQFFWEVKANLKWSHFELLRQAGVTWLQPGIESLSDRVLALMRKGQRVIQNLQVLKAARENGIRLTWNLLIGHPGETAQDLRQQKAILDTITHLQPPKVISQVRIDRFSPLFEEHPRVRPFEAYAYIYQLPPDRLRQISYYFELDDLPPPDDEIAALSRELRDTVERWQSSYLANPHLFQLYFEGPSVVDGRRAGEPAVVPLSQDEQRILQTCGQTTRITDLERTVRLDLEGPLTSLAEQGLCYRDETHVLSLVLPEHTSTLAPLPAPWRLY